MAKANASSNPRAIAARLLAKVIGEGRAFDGGSLQTIGLKDSRDIALVRELCFGTLRHYFLLEALISPLLKKSLARKDADIQALLLSGLYQLRFMQTAEHAALNTSVNACQALGKPWAKGLVNAVLRNALRKNLHDPGHCDGLQDWERQSHPRWLFELLKTSWPRDAKQILDYNNAPPSMTLRVDTTLHPRSYYLEQLEEQGIPAMENPVCDTAITLARGVDVARLPGFSSGATSVQDAGAQLAAQMLQLEAGQEVLDACAAPGGKAIHALQLQPSIHLTALDSQAERLEKLKTDLQRCRLQARVIGADAADTASWWRDERFDRILIDAPCSGTGIISHHPDIKLLRRDSDIAGFAAQQMRLLKALWPLLKPGGKMLYCTCSVLPAENSETVDAFISAVEGAELEVLPLASAIDTGRGYQLLPNRGQNGGFFFARLSKRV